MGVSRNSYNQWELGNAQPHPYNIGRLCEFFYIKDPAELDLIPPHQEVDLTQDQEHNAIPHRDKAIEKASNPDLTLFTAPNTSLNTQSFERFSALIDPLNNDGEMLDLIEQLTSTCWLLSKGSDLEIAECVLWSYLPKIVARALLPTQYQQRIATMASQGYLLAAALAGHRDDLRARQYFSEKALLYSSIAQDRNLQVAALRQLAATFDYLDQPHNVLQTYQQTLPYIEEVTPLLRACIYAGVSGTYALLQQEQEAELFMDLAYEHFPTKPEEDPCFLYANGGYYTLIFCNGLNHLDFHQPLEAEKIFEQIDGLQPKISISEKARIELLNYQAKTSIALEKMDQACIYLESAVKSAIRLRSKRRYRESLAIFVQMQGIWKNEPRVKNLEDLFQV